METKSAFDLTPKDFRLYPIWEPIDDLEGDQREVIPYTASTTLNVTGIYFIASQFKLADEFEFDGYIRMSWGKVIKVALAISDSKFVPYAVDINDKNGKYHEKFAKNLGKGIEEVFPIIFRTRIEFKLNGEII